MKYLRGGPLGQYRFFLQTLLSLCLTIRCKIAHQKSIAYFAVCHRITDILSLGIQGEHPTAVTTAVAAPCVLG